jgi:hypothetical protein
LESLGWQNHDEFGAVGDAFVFDMTILASIVSKKTTDVWITFIHKVENKTEAHTQGIFLSSLYVSSF